MRTGQSVVFCEPECYIQNKKEYIQNIFNLFDLLCILKAYLLQDELIRQRKHEVGGNLKIEVAIANTIIKARF